MTLERDGDEASNAKQQDEALAAYSAALSISASTSNAVLTKWASVMLVRYSVPETLSATIKVYCVLGCIPILIFSVQFKHPRFVIYSGICDMLEGDGRIASATECFQQMQNELEENTSSNDERAKWECGKGSQCRRSRLIRSVFLRF